MPTCASRLSFSADTLVQTPSGEQPIASLQVGDHVTSYDPTTGKATTQTITHIFVNHDSDRLDVTLALPASSSAVQPQTAAQDATTARMQRALLLSHGRRGPPDTAEAITSAASSSTAAAGEVIHTTANHPWLTADRGWVVAGQLHDGEPVRRLDGATVVVVGLHAVAGVGAMWDLSLDATHTFAVGTDQAVVHNEGPCGSDQYSQNRYSGNLYRGDGRSPDEIFTTGFQPHGSDTDLGHHLMTKLEDTAWVSTSKSTEVAAIYAAGNDGYVYGVHTSGVDVNALMDQGYYTFNEPGRWEQEVAVLGGIPKTHVLGAWPILEGDGVATPVRLGPFISNPSFKG